MTITSMSCSSANFGITLSGSPGITSRWTGNRYNPSGTSKFSSCRITAELSSACKPGNAAIANGGRTATGARACIRNSCDEFRSASVTAASMIAFESRLKSTGTRILLKRSMGLILSWHVVSERLVITHCHSERSNPGPETSSIVTRRYEQLTAAGLPLKRKSDVIVVATPSPPPTGQHRQHTNKQGRTDD